ncbi:probable ethanolamine kinase [Impatiens glandulifera]|uniref:probable ethanolamine kinase n=1 Tax=Impatiens glandulifera TaxID=253017 RepID=UPI001FB0DC1A|nr:probable ethanolamine kinase [Impatiens glandulifera]
MGALNIWNAIEIPREAQENGSSESEIPSSSISIDHSLSVPEIKPHIVELLKDLFKKWTELDSSHFSIETVSGGITNLLLKVTVADEHEEIVKMTVRLFGPNTEYVINRERELLVSCTLYKV